MSEDEMNDFDLVEALMKRNSNIQTKEEGALLDRLIKSGEISSNDLEAAKNEVKALQAILPLIDEEEGAEFPEYARERLQTKVKQTFDNSQKTESNRFSMWKILLAMGSAAAILVFSLSPSPEPNITYQFATIDLIGTVRGGNETQENDFFPNEVIAEKFDDLDKLDEWVKNRPKNANVINVKVMYDKIDNVIKINFKFNGQIIEKNIAVKDSFEDEFIKIKDIVEKEITSRK